MRIWYQDIKITDVNKLIEGSFAHYLGINYTQITEDQLTATLEITKKLHQPYGHMHGGISAVLAEEVGSAASNMTLDNSQYYAVGMNLTTYHLRSIDQGLIQGIGRAIKLGQNSQLWEICIYDSNKQLLSENILTTYIKKRLGP